MGRSAFDVAARHFAEVETGLARDNPVKVDLAFRLVESAALLAIAEGLNNMATEIALARRGERG